MLAMWLSAKYNSSNEEMFKVILFFAEIILQFYRLAIRYDKRKTYQAFGKERYPKG